MTTRKTIKKLMTANGFVLIRSNKHLVWKHTTIGKNIITSSTPSDGNAINNIKKDIQKVLAFAA